MENTSIPRQQKKRGPKKRDYVHGHFLLPPDLLDWGKDQQEGFSALLRRLLLEEKQRQREVVSAYLPK